MVNSEQGDLWRKQSDDTDLRAPRKPNDDSGAGLHNSQGALFDQYATSYDAALNRALASTGEQRAFYASRRISWSAYCASQFAAGLANILDFGCGDGANASLLLEYFKARRVIGVDASKESVRQACSSGQHNNAEFFTLQDFQPCAAMDLVYCNGVFHHIPRLERSHWLEYVRASLRPGGLFAFWENNPWNPGTRT
jgi:SAM-dependent methyltransferase